MLQIAAQAVVELQLALWSAGPVGLREEDQAHGLGSRAGGIDDPIKVAAG